VYEYSRFIGKPILNETRDDVFTTNNATGDDGGNKTDDNSDRGGVVVNSIRVICRIFLTTKKIITVRL
jgi:hypothetical protein